jgi:hypothetical protein
MLRLSRQISWSRPAIFFFGLLAAGLYWIDFLFFTRPAELLTNWPFSLALTILGLAAIYFLLRLPLWWRLRKESAHVGK